MQCFWCFHLGTRWVLVHCKIIEQKEKKDNIQVDISFFVQGFQCILRYAKLCQSSLEKIMIISKKKSDYGVVQKNENEVEEDSQNEKKKR